MSGLEVVAVVAGIVGAYAASMSVFYSWSSKRAARKANAQNQGMEVSLKTGQTGVQRVYDQGFASLGRTFAVGDDHTRAELLKYALEMVKLQQVYMGIMAKDSTPTWNGAVVLPDLPNLLQISEGTRKGVVGVLGDQYQRMEQARPLARELSPMTQYQPVPAPVSEPWDSNEFTPTHLQPAPSPQTFFSPEPAPFVGSSWAISGTTTSQPQSSQLALTPTTPSPAPFVSSCWAISGTTTSQPQSSQLALTPFITVPDSFNSKSFPKYTRKVYLTDPLAFSRYTSGRYVATLASDPGARYRFNSTTGQWEPLPR